MKFYKLKVYNFFLQIRDFQENFSRSKAFVHFQYASENLKTCFEEIVEEYYIIFIYISGFLTCMIFKKLY